MAGHAGAMSWERPQAGIRALRWRCSSPGLAMRGWRSSAMTRGSGPVRPRPFRSRANSCSDRAQAWPLRRCFSPFPLPVVTEQWPRCTVPCASGSTGQGDRQIRARCISTAGKRAISRMTEGASSNWRRPPPTSARNASCSMMAGSRGVTTTGRPWATGTRTRKNIPKALHRWPRRSGPWAWASACGSSRKWSIRTAISIARTPTGLSRWRAGPVPRRATSWCWTCAARKCATTCSTGSTRCCVKYRSNISSGTTTASTCPRAARSRSGEPTHCSTG